MFYLLGVRPCIRTISGLLPLLILSFLFLLLSFSLFLSLSPKQLMEEESEFVHELYEVPAESPITEETLQGSRETK